MPRLLYSMQLGTAAVVSRTSGALLLTPARFERRRGRVSDAAELWAELDLPIRVLGLNDVEASGRRFASPRRRIEGAVGTPGP
jgi:hypothetical protein